MTGSTGSSGPGGENRQTAAQFRILRGSRIHSHGFRSCTEARTAKLALMSLRKTGLGGGRRTFAVQHTHRFDEASAVMPHYRLRRNLLITLMLFGVVPTASPAGAAVDTWCGPGLGGNWDGQSGRCELSVSSPANATMNIDLSLPAGLLDNAVAGPVLRDYALKRGEGWRSTAQSMMRDSTSSVEYTIFQHGSTQSVVFHEQFHTVGNVSNDAYRTFTFDFAARKQLQLTDLFAPGIDPLTAIPPVARPLLEEALPNTPPPHQSGVYPFVLDLWEPRPDGSGFSGNYRAFALTPDELILYMPDVPMTHENPPPRGQWQWSMNGGTVTLHVPLKALHAELAPAYA